MVRWAEHWHRRTGEGGGDVVREATLLQKVMVGVGKVNAGYHDAHRGVMCVIVCLCEDRTALGPKDPCGAGLRAC